MSPMKPRLLSMHHERLHDSTVNKVDTGNKSISAHFYRELATTRYFCQECLIGECPRNSD